MRVTETFFSVGVGDMARATAFYVGALGAEIAFATPAWSSLRIAGVRVGLYPRPGHVEARVGLHFVVSDLAAALVEVERAGGRAARPVEVAPGVIVADATDTEGNTFAFRAA